MKKSYIKILALLILGIAFSNCVSVSGYQTGRVLAQDDGEFMLAANATKFYEFPFIFDREPENSDTTKYYPFGDISFRYGLGSNLDIGFKINSSLATMLDLKYQFIGDQESFFTASIGSGIGGPAHPTVDQEGGMISYQFSIFTSVHTVDKIDLYLSPRLIGQNSEDKIKYTGFNTGLLYGHEQKFGLDFGFYTMTSTETPNLRIFNVGVAFKQIF